MPSILDPFSLAGPGGNGGTGGGPFSNTKQQQDNSTNYTSGSDLYKGENQTITYQSVAPDVVTSALNTVLNVVKAQQDVSRQMFNESVGLVQQVSSPDTATAKTQIYAFSVVVGIAFLSWAYKKSKGKK